MISSSNYSGASKPVPRTALITGGSGILGFSIAEQLAEGRKIALLDMGADVEERASSIDALGLACDVADEDALRAAFEEAHRALGPIGIIVHCAGVAPVAPFLDTERADFDRAMAVNTTAAFLLYQRAARVLVEEGLSGRFITISSISGARAGFGRTAYGTAKAALIHLTGQMALELAPYGITANSVGPGPVDSPLSRGAHTAEARADYVRTIPMGRYGVAEEIAHAVRYLASDEASYVTGQTLFVDGGYMAAGMGVSIAQSAAAVRRTMPKRGANE